VSVNDEVFSDQDFRDLKPPRHKKWGLTVIMIARDGSQPFGAGREQGQS